MCLPSALWTNAANSASEMSVVSNTGCSALRPGLLRTAPPPAKAELALSKLDEQGHRHLTHHGLLAVTVTIGPFAHVGTFKWLASPSPDDTDQRLSGATWYCDGSLLDGRWKSFCISTLVTSGKLVW